MLILGPYLCSPSSLEYIALVGIIIYRSQFILPAAEASSPILSPLSLSPPFLLLSASPLLFSSFPVD